MDPQSQTTPENQPVFQNPQSEVQNTQPVEVKKPKSKFLTIILVVLTLALAGTIAYLGYQNWQLQQEIRRYEEIIKVDNTPYDFPSPTPTPDPTANWNIYVNQDHGFSLKYPKQVYLQETNGVNAPLVYIDSKPITVPSTYGGQLTPLEIRTAPLIKQQTAQEAATISKSLFYPENYSEKPITEPTKGVIVSGTGQGYGIEGSKYTRVFLEEKGLLVVFDFQENDAFSEELFNQILSTFQFLDQTAENVNWKTFNDGDYPFSIQYPNGWDLRKTYGTSVSNTNNSRISGVDISTDPTFGSTVAINIIDPQGLSLVDWVKQHSGNANAPDSPNSSYNNHPAFRFEHTREGRPNIVDVYYQEREVVVFLASNASLADQDTANQILSTFQFTN